MFNLLLFIYYKKKKNKIILLGVGLGLSICKKLVKFLGPLSIIKLRS